MLCPQYFTTLSQKILSGRLLLAVNGGQQSNFIGEFKLKPVTTYSLGFVVKILWM